MTAARYRTKAAKQLIARILAACPDAEITFTASGHLKVTGPGGFTILPSKRFNPETTTKLARYAGINLKDTT